VGVEYTPVKVQTDPNAFNEQSEPELLKQILMELKAVSHYLKELPYMLNQGEPFREEPGDIADSYTKFSPQQVM
jgi:hypothetical protein